MRKSLCGFIILMQVSFLSLQGQPWMKQPLVSSSTDESINPRFPDIQKKFSEYWESRNPSVREEENISDGGYQQFRRWEWFMNQRTWPTGNYFNPEILYQEYQRKKSNEAARISNSSTPLWSFIGPAVVPIGGGGAGRINVLRFDPHNSNILYIGAACGGIWKSTNGGQNWYPLSDFLPAISIADIAINPRNTDSIYVATGDGYGYIAGGGFWGGTYSAGVMISTDGGTTWNQTSLNYSVTQATIIQRLVIHPVHPEILIAATTNGLYRSLNSGQTWTHAQSGHFYDIEFNTLNPDIIYASNTNSIYRSTDAGINWTLLHGGFTSGRISLAVTAADPDVIYVFCQNGDFWYSDDGGTTFIQQSTPNALTTFYGYYDCVLASSPTDPATVYCGGVDVVKSTDYGLTWQLAANNGGNDYVHADNHFIDFLPGSNSTVFSCNDGGIFKTTDGGLDWTDLSDGLGIKQYYRMSHSSSDPYLIYGGAQDNGTDRFRFSGWEQVYGADGMNCIVDYTNDNIVYVSFQNGELRKTTNGGNSFFDVSPSGGGPWLTPFIMNPLNPQILYAGYSDIYKTVNGGSSWTTISNFGASNDIVSIAISPADTNYLYISSIGTAYRTSDGGANWVNISSGLPVSLTGITAIGVSDYDPLKIWVTCSGFANGEKVYSSSDGGSTWVNYSGTLPNIPVNCIVYQNNSPDVLYIGTDMGVYSRDSTMNDWSTYNNGFPNVIVDELLVHYGVGKLRAATYGRGIWEADLNNFIPAAIDAGVQQILNPVLSSCDSQVTPLVRIKNYGADTLFSVQVFYNIDAGSPLSLNWNGVLLPGATVDLLLSTFTLSDGMHTISINTSHPNGQSDQNITNDLKIFSFGINSHYVSIPIAEGFESGSLPPALWTVDDASNLFILDNTTGGFGLSAVSLYADFFNVSSGVARLVSPQMNVQNLVVPVKLEFDWAYATYSPSYHDSLIIRVSTDCGATFTRIFGKGDNSLATAPSTSSIFVPQSGNWRHQVVNLSNYVSQAGLIVSIEAKTGFGNNLYLDNINIHDNSAGIEDVNHDFKVYVYPNPCYEEVLVNLSLNPGKVYDLEILDMLGRPVATVKEIHGSGLRQVSVDLSTQPAGIYSYRVSEGSSGIKTGKIVKANR